MKVLITGATGNIGREVCKKLAAAHELVYVSRRAPVGALHGTHYYADMAELSGIDAIFAKEQPQVVIHLAAMLGGACDPQPDLAQKVNVDATRSLAKAAAAHGAKHFIFTSTAAVYNQQELAPTSEDQNVDPQSVYGKTKLAAEQALAKEARAVGMHALALRVFNVYGPHLEGSLVYKLAHSTKEQPVTLFGDTTFYRDYIAIQDVVNVLTNFAPLADLPPFAVCNIASGIATSNAQLIDVLRKQGYDPQFMVRQAAPSYSWANIRRAQTALGFAPQADIVL